MTLASSTLVRYLKDHVDWPKLASGERLEVMVQERAAFDDIDAVTITACRYREDDPLRYHREVSGVVSSDAMRRYMITGRKGALVDAFMVTLRRLALILKAKPPEGWRLFSRPVSLPVYWSRLRTRPLRSVPSRGTLRGGPLGDEPGAQREVLGMRRAARLSVPRALRRAHRDTREGIAVRAGTSRGTNADASDRAIVSAAVLRNRGSGASHRGKGGVMPDVETLMKHYGYSREAAEKEVQRANCEHDFGAMCESSPFGGCIRTCQKCGQKMGIPKGCTPHRSTSARSEKP